MPERVQTMRQQHPSHTHTHTHTTVDAVYPLHPSYPPSQSLLRLAFALHMHSYKHNPGLSPAPVGLSNRVMSGRYRLLLSDARERATPVAARAHRRVTSKPGPCLLLLSFSFSFISFLSILYLAGNGNTREEFGCRYTFLIVQAVPPSSTRV